MAKLIHLLVLTTLIVWLAGSGCIGNNDDEKAGLVPNAEADSRAFGNLNELTQAEVQELEEDMTELENMLEDAPADEEILLEEVRE